MNLNVLKLTGTALAGMAITVMTGCGGGQEAGQMGSMAPQIAVETLSPSSTQLESTYPATIKGKTDIEIRPQVTGFITKVHVDEGQHVKKGQLLFTLDQVQYQAAVDQAQAAVNSAQTAVSTAQLTNDNKRRLYEKNIISQYEYQLSENDLQSAKAALAQAQAALINAKKNLAYTEVTSPSDGVVGTIPNREGSLASPSSTQALTTISDNGQVYAYFSLTEKDLLQLTDNGKRSLNEAIASMPEVDLRLADGTIYPYKGKVATVSGVIDSSTGAASVRALFDNPSGMLRSGSTGNIVMPYSEENVILIPQKATYELQDRKFVYLVNDSNQVKSAPITILPQNDGKYYVVTSGLKAGDRIAVEGVGSKLKEGLTIQPITAAQEAAQQQTEGLGSN
ncbi:MAG: efflux RND transporter periplasmic adaptor subunit [Bacteroidales bacterium]|nr:efflux RND transporter periplasmic adaptor subunit [Bacteroidales bacterium]